MNEPKVGGEDFANVSREEVQSALFAQLVIQQSNLAMMLLGKVPHPEHGKEVRDLDAAKLFIDQLEMLETKTKGNLAKHEEALLKQSLMSLRLAYVEAVEAPAPAIGTAKPPTAEAPAPEAHSDLRAQEAAGTGSNANQSNQAEPQKRFSKKYSL